ncbi:MAG: hypothetical protein IJR13_08300 [Bacteroidales bacterium]|nr:hypothetical protein [Bacteroidales bacterium]
MKQILFILALVCAVLATAQTPYMMDTATIVIGDQTTLTISDSTRFLSSQRLSQGPIVVVEQHIDTFATKGERQMQQRNVLTCFDTGIFTLHLTEQDSVRLVVLDMQGVDTASAEIRDIASIMREPYTFWEIARWILLVLVVAAAAWYAVRRYRRRTPPPAVVEPQEEKRREPADISALRDIEALRQRQLWQQGKVKEYHTELTDILRRYLEEAYAIRSTEMTSDETLDAFSATRAYSVDAATLLRQILRTADMVKFAKSEPQPYEHDRSMTNAIDFIRLTAPVRSEASSQPLNDNKQ